MLTLPVSHVITIQQSHVRRTSSATDLKTVPHSVLYSRRSLLQIMDLLRFITHRSSARFLVLYDRPFFMAYKDLCRIENLAFG